MNIYRISQTDRDGYDTYDSAVVAAMSEDEARKIVPAGGNEFNENGDIVYSHDKMIDEWAPWASNIKHVTVEYLGVGKDDLVAGVIVSSFNAG